MNQQPLSTETSNDLFQDHEFIETFDHASVGQRLLNFIIDVIVTRVALSYAVGYLFARILLAVSPETAYRIFLYESRSFETYFYLYLLGAFSFLIYYTFCEKVFRGYTLGKLITGTRAIRDDGKELTMKDALLRSLSRLVPIEPFSGFEGHPWHDRWTRTSVIRTR